MHKGILLVMREKLRLTDGYGDSDCRRKREAAVLIGFDLTQIHAAGGGRGDHAQVLQRSGADRLAVFLRHIDGDNVALPQLCGESRRKGIDRNAHDDLAVGERLQGRLRGIRLVGELFRCGDIALEYF